jgi:hypothetical protein
MVAQPSAHEVSQAFDELLEAHEMLREAERSLEDYVAHNAPPPAPEVFGNIEVLLRYNAQKERYERGLEHEMDRRANRVADYVRAASPVERLLPESARLIHAYGGSSATIPAGKRYSIFKERVLTDLSEGMPESVPLETSTGEMSAISYAVRVEEESV